MLIGIDGNEANVVNRVGIGEYGYELLREFASRELKTRDQKFIIYLKDRPLSDMPKASSDWEYRIIGPKRLWTQFRLPIELFLGEPRPDVFFTPSHYAPRWCPVPYAISIMDLSYLHFPQMFQKQDLYQLVNWTRYSAKKASKIFTISLASKNDIIKEYKVPEEKVVVTYPGVKQMKGDGKRVLNVDTPYILFVGTLQPRKNIVRLIHAFSLIHNKHPRLELLVVGRKGWLYDEILKAPRRFKVEKSVKFLDFVADSEMPNLYRNATCFILPSLYEGFGLPVLEAMKYGCPVVLSNVSSLPEAGGDAALYFDPLNVTDIAEKIEKVLSTPVLREKMIQKGYKQIKKFSWEKAARQTLSELQKLTTENG